MKTTNKERRVINIPKKNYDIIREYCEENSLNMTKWITHIATSLATSEPIKTQIFTALGEASMCWIPKPTGEFDSNTATQIGDRLYKSIKTRTKI